MLGGMEFSLTVFAHPDETAIRNLKKQVRIWQPFVTDVVEGGSRGLLARLPNSL